MAMVAVWGLAYQFTRARRVGPSITSPPLGAEAETPSAVGEIPEDASLTS